MNLQIIVYTTLLIISMLPVAACLWNAELSPAPCKTTIKPNSTRMDCSNRNMTWLPFLEKHSSLEADINELDISKNNIQSCVASAFIQFSKLQLLDMHNNSIAKFDGECFRGLDKLLVLDIRFNSVSQLSSLPMSLFDELLALEELYFSAACIPNQTPEEALPGRLFQPLLKLQVFSLTGLQLVEFPAAFQTLTSIREVYWTFGSCQPAVTLTDQSFRYLNTSAIRTLSIISESRSIIYQNPHPVTIKTNFYQSMPNLHRLNLACTYLGLDNAVGTLQNLYTLKHTFSHLILDSLSLHKTTFFK